MNKLNYCGVLLVGALCVNALGTSNQLELGLNQPKTTFPAAQSVDTQEHYDADIIKNDVNNLDEVIAIYGQLQDVMDRFMDHCDLQIAITNHMVGLMHDYLYQLDAYSEYIQALSCAKASLEQNKQIQAIKTAMLNALASESGRVLNLNLNIDEANSYLDAFIKGAFEQDKRSITALFAYDPMPPSPVLFADPLILDTAAKQADMTVNADDASKQALHQPIAEYLQEGAEEKPAGLNFIKEDTSLKAATDTYEDINQTSLTGGNPPPLPPLPVGAGN